VGFCMACLARKAQERARSEDDGLYTVLMGSANIVQRGEKSPRRASPSNSHEFQNELCPEEEDESNETADTRISTVSARRTVTPTADPKPGCAASLDHLRRHQN
jgi:hypothetical protein